MTCSKAETNKTSDHLDCGKKNALEFQRDKKLLREITYARLDIIGRERTDLSSQDIQDEIHNLFVN